MVHYILLLLGNEITSLIDFQIGLVSGSRKRLFTAIQGFLQSDQVHQYADWLTAKKTFTCAAYQLEVRHSDSTLPVHLLLMLVLHQALHQVPGVQLIISHVLRTGQAWKTQNVDIINVNLPNRGYTLTWQWVWMTASHARISSASIWMSCEGG